MKYLLRDVRDDLYLTPHSDVGAWRDEDPDGYQAIKDAWDRARTYQGGRYDEHLVIDTVEFFGAPLSSSEVPPTTRSTPTVEPEPVNTRTLAYTTSLGGTETKLASFLSSGLKPRHDTLPCPSEPEPFEELITRTQTWQVGGVTLILGAGCEEVELYVSGVKQVFPLTGPEADALSLALLEAREELRT